MDPDTTAGDTKEFCMSSNDSPLSGKVAIVTGSGRGLGLAYAAELARQGASVVINDVDAATAADAVASIEAAGGRAVAVVAPVGPTETARQLVAAAAENFGRLDILVTNAGVLRDTVLWKMSDDDFDTVINVHLRGTFTCVREAAVHMRANGVAGRIICIGSPTGQRGNFGQTNYAAAKAGIVGMVRTWALELRKAEVTVNAVIPVAATAMTATVPYFAAAVEADAKGEPMPEFFRHELGFGTADDVSGLVAYLASDAAAGVTGQAIGVGGDRIQLWSHPEPVETRYREGGWSYDDLAASFDAEFGGSLQSVGETFPPLPPELQRDAAS
jgi:3-oxoacyl-[acyl-carrier protein] reductase